MKNCDVEEVTDREVTEYSMMMHELGWHPNGMISRMTAIKGLFKWLKMKDFDIFDPELVAIPRRVYTQPRVVSEEEHKKLLTTLAELSGKATKYRKARDKAILCLLWDTGARIGELLSLDVCDVNLQERQAVIKTKKSRGTKPFRQVFWTLETSSAIQEWCDLRDEYFDARVDLEDDDALFVRVGGNYFEGSGAGGRLKVSGFGQAMRVLSVKAELKQTVNAHSYRHHKGHDLTEKGANNSLISLVLGHVHMESSYRYTQINDKKLETKARGFLDQEEA